MFFFVSQSGSIQNDNCDISHCMTGISIRSGTCARRHKLAFVSLAYHNNNINKLNESVINLINMFFTIWMRIQMGFCRTLGTFFVHTSFSVVSFKFIQFLLFFFSMFLFLLWIFIIFDISFFCIAQVSITKKYFYCSLNKIWQMRLKNFHSRKFVVLT